MNADLEKAALCLGVTNMPAFACGADDGREQGFELSVGMSYSNEMDQWCYDLGTLLGATLAVYPGKGGVAMK